MRIKSKFYCQECGHQSTSWLGRCPGCGAWNSLVEELGRRPAVGRVPAVGSQSPCPVTEVPVQKEDRLPTGIGEIDRVLGGGVVPGSLILVGGDPGMGKSTLLLQVAHRFSKQYDVVYVSGEESLRQIRIRADRLGALSSRLLLVSETDVAIIERHLRTVAPPIAIIDSIQTVFSSEVGSAPGSVAQVRECAAQFMRLAKNSGVSVFLVGHVTKEGMLAGPRVLEHMVDTVLYLEGDRHQSFRILRGVKNRFGSTNEIGIFDMQGRGLVEVTNPSEIFLNQHPNGAVPGAVVAACLEGSRPLLVEIQALVSPAGYGVPRRMTAGVDHNRVALIIAVLEKKVGLNLGSFDIYVNAVGGVRLDEPAADLSIALALVSSFRNAPVDSGLAVAGEVGLTGELRPVPGAAKRVNEAFKLGFTRFLLSGRSASNNIDESRVLQAETLVDALDMALKQSCEVE
ncbi:MAG: DNA repair protein RadA [Desulfotomaculaceae bacterium]|nr:DNA repair protein RadA [Desulfotomaculaceae bacterium]